MKIVERPSDVFYTATGPTDQVLRDFQDYTDTWSGILETEADIVAFGPRPVDEPNEARRNRAIHELEKKGTCVSRVTELRQQGPHNWKCHWNGDHGAKLKQGERVDVSHSHPMIDKVCTAEVTDRSKSGEQTLLELAIDTSIDIGDGPWRLDLGGYVPYVTQTRFKGTIKQLTQPAPRGSTVAATQNLVCSNVGRSAARRTMSRRHSVRRRPLQRGGGRTAPRRGIRGR